MAYQEVSGSIPLISTKRKALKLNGFGAFDFIYVTKQSLAFGTFVMYNNVRKYIITREYHMKIIRNAIRCKKCGEVIESKSVHDFKFCSCRACAVDGGHEYLRRCGELENWEELAETEETDD